jgi:ribonuclease-3
MSVFDINDIQKKIGYTFINPTLLRQAFITPSVTAATSNKVQNYQILEFIGDTVLSFAVVKNLAKEFCKIDDEGQMICKTNEGKLTERKHDFIKNETLAHCSTVMGLNKYVSRVYAYSSCDHKNKKGDLVEAILGAVALDSEWNIEVLSKVSKNIIRYKNVDVNYVDKLEKICESKNIGDIRYSCYEADGSYECYISIPNADKVFRGTAANEFESKNKASKDALMYMKNYEKNKVIGRDDLNPISKLNELSQINKITKPIYKFENVHNDLEGYWKCSVTLSEIEYEFCAEGKTLKEAKRLAAESLIDYINGEKSEETNIIYDDEYVVRGQGLLKLIMSKYFVVEHEV